MERIQRIETWARLGYAARGMVYVLLGWIALSSGKALSTDEAVEAFSDLPGGPILLPLLAVGLFGYGAYKIYSAILDLDNKGKDAKAWVVRGARVGGGGGYLLLAFIAAKQAFKGKEGAVEAGQSEGSGGVKQEAASQVADAAGGDLLLTLIGIVVLAVAVAQLVIAYRAKFMDEMPGAPRLVKPAGQAGYAARAVVIAMVGYFVVQAGLDGERLRSFGDALALLREDHATWFKLIAGGLLLFGLVSLAMARYRRVADDNVITRLRSKTG